MFSWQSILLLVLVVTEVVVCLIIPPITLPFNMVNRTRSQQRSASSTRGGAPNLWPKLFILYSVSPYFKPEDAEAIDRAFREFRDNTCFTFTRVSFNGHEDIRVEDGGCETHLGYIGSIPQIIKFQENRLCITHGTMLQFISLTLGIPFEHNRADRNQYVSINLNNLHPACDFALFKSSDVPPQNGRYDYQSGLHYGSSDCANGAPVIQTLDGTFSSTIGQHAHLTSFDYDQVLEVYCKYTCPNDNHCINDGRRNPADCSQCRCPNFFAGSQCHTVARHSDSGLCRQGEDIFLRSGIFHDIGMWDYEVTDISCFWHVRAPLQQRVRVEELWIYQMGFFKDNCLSHWLEFRDGWNIHLQGRRYCKGTWIHPFTSRFEDMVIHFYSHGYHRGLLRGPIKPLAGFDIKLRAVTASQARALTAESEDSRTCQTPTSCPPATPCVDDASRGFSCPCDDSTLPKGNNQRYLRLAVIFTANIMKNSTHWRMQDWKDFSDTIQSEMKGIYKGIPDIEDVYTCAMQMGTVIGDHVLHLRRKMNAVEKNGVANKAQKALTERTSILVAGKKWPIQHPLAYVTDDKATKPIKSECDFLKLAGLCKSDDSCSISRGQPMCTCDGQMNEDFCVAQHSSPLRFRIIFPLVLVPIVVFLVVIIYLYGRRANKKPKVTWEPTNLSVIDSSDYPSPQRINAAAFKPEYNPYPGEIMKVFLKQNI